MNANESKTDEPGRAEHDATRPDAADVEAFRIDLVGGDEAHHAAARRIIAEAARNPFRRHQA